MVLHFASKEGKAQLPQIPLKRQDEANGESSKRNQRLEPTTVIGAKGSSWNDSDQN